MTDGISSSLTEAQTLLWTAEQMNPGAPIYNQAFAFVIDDDLEPDRFRESFSLLISQCDALRTVVDQSDGAPTQRVVDEISFELPILDLSSDREPEKAFRAWAIERISGPMEISERMFDAAFARLGPGKTGFFLCQHHMMTDAWSFSLLIEQLERIYVALDRAVPALPDPMPAFADYVRTQHRDGAGLEDDPVATPGSIRPPALYGEASTASSSANERIATRLGEHRSNLLGELAAQPGIRALTADMSRFRLFTTALIAYLHRVSGEYDITIGAPSHNRVTESYRRTVGLFTEVFPLSVSLGEDETFESLFDKVVEATDKFLRSSRPGGSAAEVNRVVNVVLNYITSGFRGFDGAPIHSEWLHTGHVEPEHHLRLHVTDFDLNGDFELLFDLNEDVLDGPQRRRAVKHFLAILDAMLTDFTGRVSSVPLITTEEARLLDAINATSQDDLRDDTILDLFDDVASDRPDAPAVVHGDRVLTYEQLDRLTRIAASKIPQGSIIGLCLPRSPDAVLAILAVLRAGSAYVPIDPSWPERRIQYVLEDAACDMVIADSSSSIEGIGVDELTAGDQTGDRPEVSSGDLAYIIYTSGSTGQPKGVMVQHGSLANYAAWARDYYDKGERLSFPLFSPLTFDLTVTSIFVPLISGGQIVVYADNEAGPDLSVQAVFDDDLIDIVKLTPSHLSLLKGIDLSDSRVSQLILGGEELTTSAAHDISTRLGGALVHNEYGPTEATVGCIIHTYDPKHDKDLTVPIGQPIANMRAHIVGPSGTPAPVGVPGELWLAGAGIAKGYVNRPDLTAERFIEAAVDEGTLYATGDRARFRPDGIVEYLGRTDDQVKVKGVRIELGEIESVLASHPAVASAVAAVHHRAEPPSAAELFHCARCGLPSNYPGVSFDTDGVCNQCRTYDIYADRADVYFKPMTELEEIFRSARNVSNSDYDCVSLLSGGKDSTYALCRLVDMGIRPLAFTLDNGYISEQAKANIRRVCETLGVDHVFGETPAMNEIFVDSLQRHANVCNGCFKTIYTLSMQLARENGIPLIVTGLSRGQFFETRLTPELFADGSVSSEDIDDKVLEARKAYHQVEDAPRRLLDVRIFDNEKVFEDLEFVDFYRYCDVDLDEMLTYLNSKVPWIRPSDTGRSTNCLINDVGIFVHQRERGFHNYALPYSWDVRLGVKTRDDALDELDDDIDVEQVQAILDEIGYPEDIATIEGGATLVAYYTGERVPPGELRRHLEQSLPSSMMPARLIHLDELPLTSHGKVDRDALPDPGTARPDIETRFIGPRTETEQFLAGLWSEVLGIDEIGVRDNFFDLGGDSIKAIQIVTRARRAGFPVNLRMLFETLTVEELGKASDTSDESIDPSEPQSEQVERTTEFPHANLDEEGMAKLAALLDSTGGGE